MTKRVQAILIIVALALLCGGGLVAAGPVVDSAQSRYPGSIRSVDEQIDFAGFAEGELIRQAEYWTADNVRIVAEWYAERLPISPSTTVYTGGDGCTLMSQANVIYHFEHSRVILICALARGTQVVVNEKVALLP
jgi:hypothetical protein